MSVNHFILIHTLFTKTQPHLNSVIYLEDKKITRLHRIMHFPIHCPMSELSVVIIYWEKETICAYTIETLNHEYNCRPRLRFFRMIFFFFFSPLSSSNTTLTFPHYWYQVFRLCLPIWRQVPLWTCLNTAQQHWGKPGPFIGSAS